MNPANVEDWVREALDLIARCPRGDQKGEFAAAMVTLVRAARDEAERAKDGAKVLAEVSGRLRAEIGPGDPRSEGLAALALAFSRASGEVAGSPT